MQPINAENAVKYLRAHGHARLGDSTDVRELSGGVSNAVLRVTPRNSHDFIVKQALAQLRVSDPWFCDVARIWRETEVMRVCQGLVSSDNGSGRFQVEIPQVLFEDRDNFLFGMTAAPADHTVWKKELLSGKADADIAAACGDLLGCLHARTWHNEQVACQLEDRQFFDDLRLDPFYRQIALVHKDLRAAIEELVDSVWRERHALVHGDFSPKNLLIYGDRLMLIDFEVGHYGDPAFDLGFFLSHLILKAFYRAPSSEPYFELITTFWNHYRQQMLSAISSEGYDSLVRRSILNMAACALARMDGKSKVDYLTSELRRDQVRQLSRVIFVVSPDNWEQLLQITRRVLSET